MIRAITFDFWGTLFRDANSDRRQELRICAFAHATGLEEQRIAQALQATTDEFARCHIEEQRTLTPEDAVRLTGQILRINIEEEVAALLAELAATAILQFPPLPIPNALDAVCAAVKYVPIGLISDTGISPGSSLRQILNRNGFSPHFTTMTFSDEVGVAKPQAAMFERTADALNVDPSELLHLGDLEPTDIAGIHQVGGIAGLFAGVNDRFLNVTKADYAFTAWSQFIQRLPDILRRQ